MHIIHTISGDKNATCNKDIRGGESTSKKNFYWFIESMLTKQDMNLIDTKKNVSCLELSDLYLNFFKQ